MSLKPLRPVLGTQQAAACCHPHQSSAPGQPLDAERIRDSAGSPVCEPSPRRPRRAGSASSRTHWEKMKRDSALIVQSRVCQPTKRGPELWDLEPQHWVWWDEYHRQHPHPPPLSPWPTPGLGVGTGAGPCRLPPLSLSLYGGSAQHCCASQEGHSRVNKSPGSILV